MAEAQSQLHDLGQVVYVAREEAQRVHGLAFAATLHGEHQVMKMSGEVTHMSCANQMLEADCQRVVQEEARLMATLRYNCDEEAQRTKGLMMC